MNLRLLTTLISLSVFTLIFCGCKSTLPIKKNNEAATNTIHEKLTDLIKKDSVNSFYKLFTEQNYKPNHINELGTTLLFDAVSYENTEICSFLLKKGAGY